MDIRRQRGSDGFVLNACHGDGRPVGSRRGLLEEVHRLFLAVENAAKLGSIAERPVHGQRVDAKDRLQLVEQLQWGTRGAVEFVHEGEDRNAPFAADFEKFARLGFDAFAGIDNHHCRIDSGEDAIGIFREILVAGRVEEVDHAVAVVELQDGG